MIGVGIAWASILSMPYAILTGSLPPSKMGYYMGVFNFFIVIPQIVAAAILGWRRRAVLRRRGDLCAARSAESSFVLAALLTFRVDDPDDVAAAVAIRLKCVAENACAEKRWFHHEDSEPCRGAHRPRHHRAIGVQCQGPQPRGSEAGDRAVRKPRIRPSSGTAPRSTSSSPIASRTAIPPTISPWAVRRMERCCAAFQGGDLAGVLRKLEEGYFDALGVDAIWMTPFVEQIHGSVDEGTGKDLRRSTATGPGTGPPWSRRWGPRTTCARWSTRPTSAASASSWTP